jgi:hypothetical protein
MAPLSGTAGEPPDNVRVVIKADAGHNPYIATSYGAVGRSWLATVTNKENEATVTLMVSAASGSQDPPTAGQICKALQADLALSELSAEQLAKHFGYKLDGHSLADAAFVKGALARRAAYAKLVGLDPSCPAVKNTKETNEQANGVLAPPAPPAPVQRTRKKNSDAPAALPPPPPPPPPPGRPDVAAVLDF